MKIGLFSFFAGAGFLDLGFEKSNHFEIIHANEFSQPFVEIYSHARLKMGIKPPSLGISNGDIQEYLSKNKLSWLRKEIANYQLKNKQLVGFIGGPPCPDFSVGGKNKGHKGDNGKLSGTYIDLICKSEPDFFLFENVKGLYRTKMHREFFEDMKSKLIKAGYDLTENLINAIEYGAPQDRERIILIGFKRNVLLKLGYKLSPQSEITDYNWENYKLYNAEKVFFKQWPSLEPFKQDNEKSPPSHIIKKLTVEYWFKKNKVELHPNADKYFQPKAGLIKFQNIPEGDDLKKSYKRLHRWRYSPTAAYGNNEVHLHPYKARRLSAAEALAIQSLPMEFEMPEKATLSNMFKTIGNGVPFLAALGIANNIADFINKREIKKSTNAKINSREFSSIY